MSINKKWDDASREDLIFAVLMSTGDGSGNIKADWQKVDKIMNSWGYTFTIGAMSQHWSKTIQKAFKERHPDNVKDGDKTNPSTPSKAGGTGTRAPKTPASSKGKGKGRKRPAPEEDADDTSPESGAPNPTPIAKDKTPRASAKKMKYSEETDVDEEEEEENVMVNHETNTDEDYNHAG